MKTKNLAILAGAAVVLGGAAWCLNSGRKIGAPQLAGRAILPAFPADAVARIEIGGSKPLKLAASDDGWKIESLYGYPADMTKIRENLMKLQELKVGQVARGRKIDAPTLVDLQDAKGKSLAALTLGDKHNRKPPAGGMSYGGYPDGRYVKYGEETVLVKETLDAFDGDPKSWCDARIASVTASDVQKVVFEKGGEKTELVRTNGTWNLVGLKADEELDTSKTYSLDSALSYLDFSSVADPAKEAEYGFATGAVYTVTVKDGSNTVQKVARIGGKAANGDRYLKLDGSKWIFTVSSYSADSMSKTRKDLVKAKEKPKAEEKKADSKKADDKKSDAKKADAK